MDIGSDIKHELVAQTGVTDFDKLTQNDVPRILKLVGSGALGSQHLQLLTTLAPHFTDLLVELIKADVERTKSADEALQSQLTIITLSIKGTLEALCTLAKGAQTDDCRLALAEKISEVGRQHAELVDIAQKMASEHNKSKRSLSSRILTIGAFVVGGVVLGAGAVAATKK
ncbi:MULTISPECIES: hypothetical protein [Aeromonas]|uniref:hypothetical protein n=1 Tax=Aeromonas TaxID=642 RepID=UPI00191ED0F6|nr:hypothetical protein [Aeromonas caviae]MBL0662673.1 hypothetical protein [Aeromonas caviae]